MPSGTRAGRPFGGSNPREVALSPLDRCAQLFRPGQPLVEGCRSQYGSYQGGYVGEVFEYRGGTHLGQFLGGGAPVATPIERTPVSRAARMSWEVSPITTTRSPLKSWS